MNSKRPLSSASPQQSTGDMLYSLVPLGTVLVLVLVGFWLRVTFWLASVYHIDEFISMLAAQMVAERGLPILPSGIFYDHGLLQTMFSGLFLALFDFHEEIARWPTLLLGVLTIAGYFTVARTIFGSSITALLAAALVTFDSLSIEWSVRARMYTWAHLFVLLSLAWLLRSFFQKPGERSRYLFLVFLAAALLSHTAIFVILAPLAVLTVVFSLVYSRRWLHQPRLWLQAIVGLLLLAGVALIVYWGQNSSAVSLPSDQAASPETRGLDYFLQPGLTWSRFDDLTLFFLDFPYNWQLLCIGIGFIAVILRFQQKQATFADWAFCFLLLYFILIIAGLGGLAASKWQKDRYLFFLNLPAFFLLAAEGMNRLLLWGAQGLSRLAPQREYAHWIGTSLTGLGILTVVLLLGPTAYETAKAQSTGGYDTAFSFVRDQWQEDDRVMTVHPAAAYLYLEHNDYYANQTTAKVFADEDDPGDPIDRYTGTPLIDSIEELNSVLGQEKRLWFVVDIKRLYRRFDFFFTQQIFSQMNHVRQFGEVYVFVSESFPRPLPPTPQIPLEAQFDQMVRLEGYSLDMQTLAPDGTLPLHLYWRPLQLPSRPFKIFVQLRDSQGQNIAQADHYLFEQLLTGREWQELQEDGEWLRESALLQLPLPLPPEQGPYHLYLGLYDPDTFERVPLLNDTSGENAVILPFSSLP